MHIDFLINERDYRSAALLAMKKRSNLSALDYYGPYAVTILWVALSVVPNPANNYLDDPVDLLMTLGALPIMLAYLYMRRSRLDKEYRKLRSLHLLQALDIDTQGFRLVTSEGIVRTKWTTYSKFAEDKESFVLFHRDSVVFFPIPKPHLSVSQVDELHTLLSAYLPVA
jgi:hypothetical protein